LYFDDITAVFSHYVTGFLATAKFAIDDSNMMTVSLKITCRPSAQCPTQGFELLTVVQVNFLKQK